MRIKDGDNKLYILYKILFDTQIKIRDTRLTN